MTKRQKYQIGDEVYWNDPDNDICSGVYTFVRYETKDVAWITNAAGSEAQVFVSELS